MTQWIFGPDKLCGFRLKTYDFRDGAERKAATV